MVPEAEARLPEVAVGHGAEVLLVGAMRILIAALVIGLCLGPQTAAGVISTAAEDHDAFWLWAGVAPQPVLARAERLYLLQGEVKAKKPVRLVARRPAVPRIGHAEV